jgi:hypothetical protein
MEEGWPVHCHVRESAGWLWLGEVGREKIHVIFGRRYHRNTGTQYHTAIATLFFPDVADLELLEFLVLISSHADFEF